MNWWQSALVRQASTILVLNVDVVKDTVKSINLRSCATSIVLFQYVVCLALDESLVAW